MSRHANGRPTAQPPRPLRGSLWEIQLLGGLQARNGDVVVTRFATRAVVELLAALLLGGPRSHAREELIERLWPTAELGAGRNRLRNALSQLKAVFGRSGAGDTGIIVADRYTVRLDLDAVACDAVDFEQHLRHGRHEQARACYRGELLPGWNADWLHDERLRLAALYERLAEAAGRPAPVPPEAPMNGAGQAPPPRRRLPTYRSSFIGRERDVERLSEAIAAHRLVTVTGPGGCGKTRLCIETARRQRGFDTVGLVLLDECHDAALLADHVREALGLQAGAQRVLRQIVASLEGQRTLLVLDGFEQLRGETAAATLAALLEGLPQLHLVVSSQAATGLAAEHELRLAPLPLPDGGLAAESAVANPCVALFLHRARTARADFNVHGRNVADIVALCHAAGGLPLAIELAASRVRGVSPRRMRSAMAADWPAQAPPAAGGATAVRHASIVTTIEWSLGLLDAGQHAFLADVSVFRGRWTAGDAAAVTGVEPERCATRLAELVRVSLLEAEADEGARPRRHHLPRHIADVVGARLDRRRAAELRSRHRAHFLAGAAAASQAHRLVDAADLPNLVAALASALDDGDRAVAHALVLAMGLSWSARGLPEEAAGLLRRVVAQAPDDDASVPVLALVARLFVQVGHAAEARALAARALRAARSPAGRAEALLAEVNVSWRIDRVPLPEQARQALELARALARPALLARALLQQGALLATPASAVAAEQLFAEAQQLCRERGDEVGALAALPGLAICLSLQRRDAEAVELSRHGIEQARRLQHGDVRMLLFNRLGHACERLRRYRQALVAYERQAVAAREAGMVYHLAFGIWNLCLPLVRLRRDEPAAMLMAFSKRYWVDHFGPLQTDDRAYLRQVRDAVVARIGRARWRRHWAAGWSLSLPGALALAAANAARGAPVADRI